MHWQDVVGVLTNAGQFALRVFWDPDRNGAPNIDVARNLAFTLLTFLLGWLVTVSGGRKRLKERVIAEMLQAQSELMARAYPKKWKRDDKRAAWMLGPLVQRIQFLHEHLRESKGLRRGELILIQDYKTSVEKFIEKWAEAKQHGSDFDALYAASYWRLRKAVTTLGLKELTRLTGLMPGGPLYKKPLRRSRGEHNPKLVPKPELTPAE